MIYKILGLLLVLSFPLSAANGWLNVFTDINGTEIYVDGRLVAQDQLVAYELPEGEHYLKVDLDKQKIYAEKFTIQANRTFTIVSDHFVDFRTQTPSRGAIEREAFRLRQVKGYTGFGLFLGSPASGLSFKWWAFERLGLQLIAFSNNQTGMVNEDFGFRLLIGFSDKVAFSQNLNAYMALGTASRLRRGSEDYQAAVTSLAFGLEGQVGELANALFLNRQSERKVVIIKDQSKTMEDTMYEWLGLVMQIATLGLLNTNYVSVEIGLENISGQYLNPVSPYQRTSPFLSFGLHYFF